MKICIHHLHLMLSKKKVTSQNKRKGNLWKSKGKMMICIHQHHLMKSKEKVVGQNKTKVSTLRNMGNMTICILHHYSHLMESRKEKIRNMMKVGY